MIIDVDHHRNIFIICSLWFHYPKILRIPSVQTIDDLMVEKCQPGDVLLFDRRCDYCASGFVSAMACYVGKAILCEEDDGTRSVERGKYEHCGE